MHAPFAEKPYIHCLDPLHEKWELVIPTAEAQHSGPSNYENLYQNSKKVDFSRVFIADPSMDADKINAGINGGENSLILTPGNYNLDKPITITKSAAVIYGMGMPTLIANKGNSCIEVKGEVDDVRISGLILQAGYENRNS